MSSTTKKSFSGQIEKKKQKSSDFYLPEPRRVKKTATLPETNQDLDPIEGKEVLTFTLPTIQKNNLLTNLSINDGADQIKSEKCFVSVMDGTSIYIPDIASYLLYIMHYDESLEFYYETIINRERTKCHCGKLSDYKSLFEEPTPSTCEIFWISISSIYRTTKDITLHIHIKGINQPFKENTKPQQAMIYPDYENETDASLKELSVMSKSVRKSIRPVDKQKIFQNLDIDYSDKDLPKWSQKSGETLISYAVLKLNEWYQAKKDLKITLVKAAKETGVALSTLEMWQQNFVNAHMAGFDIVANRHHSIGTLNKFLSENNL
jgi:hypothetical protein